MWQGSGGGIGRECVRVEEVVAGESAVESGNIVAGESVVGFGRC